MYIQTNQLFIAICAYLGQISISSHAVWSVYGAQKLTDEGYLEITPEQLNWLTSLIYLGIFTGTFILGGLNNRIGRKPTLIIGGSLVSVVSLGLLFPLNVYVIMFWRGLVGFGFATIFSTNLVYLGEISSTEVRGILLGGIGFSMNLGFLMVYSIGSFVSYQVFAYLFIAIPVVYTVGLLFIPESPIFLISKGQDEKAKKVLLSLGRERESESLSDFKQELHNKENLGRLIDLLRTKSNKKALFITGALFFFQAFHGMVPLLVYVIKVFEISGSSIAPNIATIIVGSAQFLAGAITPIFVERNGRRFLLLCSSAMTFVSLSGLAVYLHLVYLNYDINQNVRWLPLAFLLIFFIAYSFGIGVVPNIMVGEMFDLSVRSAGSAVALTVNWTFSVLILISYGYIVFAGGVHLAYYIFSCFCALTFMFTVFYVPETKGKSLIEIQHMLNE